MVEILIELSMVLFFENYVATKLINFGYKLFYWKGKGDSEFEFVIESESTVIPIDVKKSKRKLNSLDKFKEHNALGYAVKVSKNNYGYDSEHRILTLLFYFLPFYLRELQEKEKRD